MCEFNVDTLGAGTYEYDPTTRALVTQSLEVVSTVVVRPFYYADSSSSSQGATAQETYSSLKAMIEGSASSVLSYMRTTSTHFQPSTATPTVTVSSYSMHITHSALPTSTPTSAPSCGVGSEGTSVQCTPCQPGFYLSDVSQVNCKACPLDYYSDTFGAGTCQQCSSPRAAFQLGSTECTAYYLNYRQVTIIAATAALLTYLLTYLLT